MIEITITVEDDAEANDIIAVLSAAEEEGELDFPFGVQTHRETRRELVENLGFRLRK